MSISPELMTAILSMDSYNRSYNPGIEGLGDEIGTKIGEASISKRLADVSDTLDDEAQAAGFYAIAYDWNGQTVISYRGKDRLLPSISDCAN